MIKKFYEKVDEIKRIGLRNVLARHPSDSLRKFAFQLRRNMRYTIQHGGAIDTPPLYSVIVQDGEVGSDINNPIRPNWIYACDHNHKTKEAAEKCLSRLIAKDNAKWRNGKVFKHGGDMCYFKD
jgi:hypothetical protein